LRGSRKFASSFGLLCDRDSDELLS
ncbi:uncharacterized protein METZ01_LOCUS194703, partial [marine metagenome]